MEKRFEYRLDRRARRITAIVIAAVALLSAAALCLWVGSSYYSAWLLSNIAAVAGLYILSIPRHVAVTEAGVEIHCLVELTILNYDDLRSVRRVGREELKYCIPLLGSYGFFGYYGYYFNLRDWSVFKIYASEWNNFVEIEDVYEQIYVVSCPDADRLTELIEKNRTVQ
ncbi:MAG: hypothetical protein LBH06_00660 [Rikenellaceae bacterium]|jgi:hypothetical protein|nr:hypothetical protein [Rikenellaceae bacterium]